MCVFSEAKILLILCEIPINLATASIEELKMYYRRERIYFSKTEIRIDKTCLIRYVRFVNSYKTRSASNAREYIGRYYLR